MNSIATARGIAALILVGMISGCGQSESGESVFIGQNKTATALAMILMEAEVKNTKGAERLYDAETTLAQACAPLRKAALQRMAGNDISFELRHLIFNSLD